MQDIKNEEYIICPRCGREVYKEAVTCPFSMCESICLPLEAPISTAR